MPPAQDQPHQGIASFEWITLLQSEEALMRMERKAREAELYAQRISMSLADLNGEGRRQLYASQALVADPPGWTMPLQGAVSVHQLGSAADQDMRPFSAVPYSRPYAASFGAASNPVSSPFGTLFDPLQMTAPPDPSVNELMELQRMRNDVEKSRCVWGLPSQNCRFRVNFAERSRQFKERLTEFRNDIDNMKREDRQTDNDREHSRNVQHGFDKMTTLRMVCSRGKE